MDSPAAAAGPNPVARAAALGRPLLVCAAQPEQTAKLPVLMSFSRVAQLNLNVVSPNARPAADPIPLCLWPTAASRRHLPPDWQRAECRQGCSGGFTAFTTTIQSFCHPLAWPFHLSPPIRGDQPSGAAPLAAPAQRAPPGCQLAAPSNQPVPARPAACGSDRRTLPGRCAASKADMAPKKHVKKRRLLEVGDDGYLNGCGEQRRRPSRCSGGSGSATACKLNQRIASCAATGCLCTCLKTGW